MLAARSFRERSSEEGSLVQISKGSRSGPSQANAEVSFVEEEVDVLELNNVEEYINDLED